MLRILLFIGLLMGVTLRAIGCSCIGASTVASALKSSDFVAVGIVKARTRVAAAAVLRSVNPKRRLDLRYTDTTFFAYRVKYTVEFGEVYKGITRKRLVDVFTSLGGGDCGYQFQVGSRYIIYARTQRTMLTVYDGMKKRAIRVAPFLATDVCTRTTEANDAEIEQLRMAVPSRRDTLRSR